MKNNRIVLYEVNQGIGRVTLNRPEKSNAINTAMAKRLIEVLITAQADSSARVIVLTGAGKRFCVGQDLASMRGKLPVNRVSSYIIEHYDPIIGLLHGMGKPVIGAINGIAAGSGVGLALACDLRVMAQNASLVQIFGNIGLIPDAGSTWFLVRQVGYSRALEIAIEGKRISAKRCLELGLANRIVEPDKLTAETQNWAEKLAKLDTYVMGLTKRAMNQAAVSTLKEAIRFEAELQQLAEEYAEAAKD